MTSLLIPACRGMGDSRLASDEDITIELLARDLLFLLRHLGWKELSLCGFSMGGIVIFILYNFSIEAFQLGVVAQQLLVLPFHPEHPTRLPFRTTHLLLAGT